MLNVTQPGHHVPPGMGAESFRGEGRGERGTGGDDAAGDEDGEEEEGGGGVHPSQVAPVVGEPKAKQLKPDSQDPVSSSRTTLLNLA